MNQKLFFASFLLVNMQVMASDLSAENVQVSGAITKTESLREEKKINRALFLPELSVTGGLGSEKILDVSPNTEKGPFLFLGGKINLYRGGRDLNIQSKTDNELTVAKMEEELKKRELNIEAYKKISEIKSLEKESELIKEEIELNKNQQKMARKKVDAGLTTSVDLVDFELKEELLQNDLDKNAFKNDLLKKELSSLFGGKHDRVEIEKSFIDSNELQAVRDDVQSLPQLLISRKKSESSLLSKKSAKAEYLPSVDLEAKYGQITPHEKLFSEDKEHQVALSITIPLFSGFSTSGRYQQAVLETTQSERELRQTELDLQTKKDLALKNIDLLKKNLASLERLLSRALKYNELTVSDYRRGVKNSPDVIAASDKKFDVQKKILQTKLELKNAVYEFNETYRSYK